jgi:hypothetical protein
MAFKGEYKTGKEGRSRGKKHPFAPEKTDQGTKGVFQVKELKIKEAYHSLRKSR